jgi:formamidase
LRKTQIYLYGILKFAGGQIGNNDSPSDIENVDLSRIHYLSGPIKVEGAEAGDVLEVEILDVQPLPGAEWGFTGIFAANNGGGFLSDTFKKAQKAIWDFEGIFATSRYVPGVKFAGTYRHYYKLPYNVTV